MSDLEKYVAWFRENVDMDIDWSWLATRPFTKEEKKMRTVDLGQMSREQLIALVLSLREALEAEQEKCDDLREEMKWMRMGDDL